MAERPLIKKTKPKHIRLSFKPVWQTPTAQNGEKYHWGCRKSAKEKPWSQENLIYRWVRSSDDKVAVIGETEDTLADRVNNYQGGGSDRAGKTNQRVWKEQQKLERKGDFFYLEYLVKLKGFNFNDKQQRRWAEGLLTACYRPYLRFPEDEEKRQRCHKGR